MPYRDLAPYRFFLLLFLGALGVFGGLIPAPALAFDFVKDTVPNKWIEPLVPEDLPALEYPEYFNDFDKAKAQMQGGRYRLSLITLAKVKDADPVEVAIVKASSLSALGRNDEALAALSAEKVKDQPRAQVLRASILAVTGKTDDAIVLLREHVKAHADSLAGHYWLGRVLEQVGDLDGA